MDDWNEAEDPYKILELDKGSEVTEAEIRKVSAVHLFAVCAVNQYVRTADGCAPDVDVFMVRRQGVPLLLQAYRKLALTKHPDKQRDNPNAAAEFNAIQRAYEKVLDPGFRDAWNQLAKYGPVLPDTLLAMFCCSTWCPAGRHIQASQMPLHLQGFLSRPSVLPGLRRPGRRGRQATLPNGGR